MILSKRLIFNPAAEKIMMFMYKQMDEGDEDVTSMNNAIVNKALVPSLCGGNKITPMGNY